MSEPRTTYDDAMRGVTFELIGAMSSLNMEPESMKEPTGSFLSESDTWASHAVEHIRAAIQLARKAEADNAALRLKMQEYNSALDAMTARYVVLEALVTALPVLDMRFDSVVTVHGGWVVGGAMFGKVTEANAYSALLQYRATLAAKDAEKEARNG